MQTAFHLKLVLGLTVVAVLEQAWPAQAGTFEDPEDSPLYAASMKNAFAEMLARDNTPASQPGPGAGGIVAVEGTQWHMLPTLSPVGRPDPLGGTTTGPLPRDITVGEATCISGSTCVAATCYPNATCLIGYPTCYVGSPTCQGTTCGVTCYRTCGTTCGPGYTCGGGGSTCFGATCDGSPTCNHSSTCFLVPTCVPAPTCNNTCALPHCSPPGITGVNIPRPGQFQFSFSAQGQQVSYHVLYCTNLDAAQWTDVFSVSANNTTVTFTHTNNAPRAFYRVSIQNL